MIKIRPSSAGKALPEFGVANRTPIKLTEVVHPDGRISQYPPPELWDEWVEWDGKEWPNKVARRYTLVPTVCFNCEAACGLLAYVDKETFEIRKFEGNPLHPGSRGRNCAKGPATLNQVYDPERILYPLKRVGKRGEGKWERISWEQALDEIAAKMRESKLRRPNGIVYHVGRPGEDGYTNRVVQTWGMDGHNSHTNVCSSSARAGYNFWCGQDRPSPDYANARAILLVSSHLESGHYFNPHAQRIIEGKSDGAKLIVMDPRLSNTASMSDIWLPTYPGSEPVVLLAIANYLIQNDHYNKEFVRRWVNWKETLQAVARGQLAANSKELMEEIRRACELPQLERAHFALFDRLLKDLYAEYTLERAAQESGTPVDRIREAARAIVECDGRLATHVWRSASVGNLGGWQVARCLFFLNVLTGSIGVKGGVFLTGWNKFVPRPFKGAPAPEVWNELHYPIEYPLAHYEMSFLLPHMLAEGRGEIDVYFTRVYNPVWINPDGFMWIKILTQENSPIKCHVALTPTWSETAWYADYVLPMGLGPERHDLMSQETHNAQWIAFRQPVRRVAMERAGLKVDFTYQANPGEVWEENEFWIQLSARMDPDGSLGVRQWFESPYRPGEIITVEEYYRWIFENSVPGLPEAAAKEGLTPLEYMRRYGVFEVRKETFLPFEREVANLADVQKGTSGLSLAANELVLKDGQPIGVLVDDVVRVGFDTPSRKLEFFSPTLHDWGWKERQYVIPWSIESHVHPKHIDRSNGEMILLPNFRLPTLIHTRSANAKWLYEISHKNPVWIHPEDARRLGVETGDLVRVETEIGYFVDTVWVTEGIRPGIVAVSHHLGRWRLQENTGVNRGASNLVIIEEDDQGRYRMRVIHGAVAWESPDPDTRRIWWTNVGVNQNLAHPVHPDPITGVHCWLQKVRVRKAEPGDRAGDVFVDTRKSMQVYREWLAMTRPADRFSPDGTRRPYWLSRPLKPTREAYRLPVTRAPH